MLVVLNNEIYNLDAAEKIAAMDKTDFYPSRIAFFRDDSEYEWASFEHNKERDVEWVRIKYLVNKLYSAVNVQ